MVYRVEELRAPDAWLPFADAVGLPVAMRTLEALLTGSRSAAVRIVRADGIAVVTFWKARRPHT
jgi:hypothetical protein